MSSSAGSNDNILFEKFCSLCDKILNSARPRKNEIIKTFINNWRFISKNSNFFPIMRLLIPQLDRDRSAYGVKEHTLAKMYTRILCLPPDGVDALKLINFRKPTVAGRHAGDFAEVAYWILKARCGDGGQLCINDVNQTLDAMSIKHAEHDPRGVDAELTILVSAMSAEEQKWLIRIILKDMNLGIGPNTVLDAFHPDAREYYDVRSSLSTLCENLRDQSVRMNEIQIQLFDPFRPMLSEELDIKRLDVHFNRYPSFFVETKMDGERFQIHMQDGAFKYFSRRGFNYTTNFGGDLVRGMLTPKLAKLISGSVRSVILDGEMMCWNTRDKKFTTKGMEIDVKKLNETHIHRPCFCPFDVLYLNGEVLTCKPLHVRLQTLQDILRPEEGVVSFVARKEVNCKEQVWESLNEAIDNCEEGIIFKERTAIYKPNARKHGGWYKIKPEYSDGLMDTLDLLIIGGYYGEGRFGGTISQFLMAVKHGDCFWSTVRVGCGYSMVELDKLLKRLEPHWLPCDVVRPHNVEWTKQKPHMCIEPSNSVILEIKASEIVPSNEYRTGCTLRFARVIKIRYDREWHDCCTYEQLQTKKNVSMLLMANSNASGKLTAHLLTEEDTALPVKKARRGKAELAEQFLGADVKCVAVLSELLGGKEICVLSGYQQMSKHDIEKRIVEFGGKTTQSPGFKTWCVLSEIENIRVKNIAASGLHDVLKCSWFIPQLSNQHSALQDIPRSAYLCVSYVTGSKLRKSYDEFGDHYTVPATLSSLKESMDIAKKMALSITFEEQCELDLELFSGRSPYSIFRGLVISMEDDYVGEDLSSSTIFHLRKASSLFILHGGQMSSLHKGTVTHLLCSRGDAQFLMKQKEARKADTHKYRIVAYEWVLDSIEKKIVLPESSYQL